MRLILLIVLIGALAVGLWGYAGARQAPVVVRYVVELPNWPANAAPLRIVQLSDLHGSRIDMPPERISTIVNKVNALQPDIIVLTGDYIGGKLFDWPPIRLEDFAGRLGALRARYGVFAVVGNHDTRTVTRRAFDRTPIRLLINQSVAAGPVTIAGIDDVTNVDNPAVALREFAPQIPVGKPIVLLAHVPDYFQYLPAGIDLMIAGHTHGGQIKLPIIGTRSLGPFLDAHLRGSFVENGQRLVVSSGLGTSIVPMRIGVRPEIVEITLGGASQGGGANQASGRKSGTDK